MDDREIKTYYTSGGSGITAPVTVPFLQAAITGLLAGIAAGVLVAILGIEVSPWAAGAVVWTLATLGSWLSFRARWQMVIERALGVDLNGDGRIGDEPEPPALPPLRVEVMQEGGRRGDFIDLPYPDRLPELASGLLSGRRQFAQTAWTGAAGVFSRAEFDNLRGEFLRRGLARWKNPQAPAQGVELTPAGRAVLRKLAGRDDSNPPTLQDGR